ncbi:hypothetical protein INS49_005543 [Diaporthe citri]|uniref:uncharacterized protein n=1 Tax=Diaporthe citri TaxID=83186 RepID=UPI001C815280|nr:uncharacterized protein INS49_005543 [Diaporthe citri]KAG6353581.1 hypothetical protein INS49_005543 [Diaporthe citri]
MDATKQGSPKVPSAAEEAQDNLDDPATRSLHPRRNPGLGGKAGGKAAKKGETAEDEEKKKDPSLNITIDLGLAVKLKIELDLEVHGRVNIGLL